MHTLLLALMLITLPNLPTWAAQTGRLNLDLGQGVYLELARIPSGDFLMGTDDRNSDEWPPHRVMLPAGFWMGIHEVTQAEWQQVMGENPSQFKGPNHPVERISWKDTQDFLKRLNHQVGSQLPAGVQARLPTEAEWVYACRAGTRTKYWFGDDESELSKYGNYADAAETVEISWRDLQHNDRFSGTAPVGSYPPNPWGLYDMHGNVWEWCADWYGPYPTNEVVNPAGPRDGHRRVIRGGGWGVTAEDCRSANRYRFKPEVNGANIGLRIVVAPPLP